MLLEQLVLQYGLNLRLGHPSRINQEEKAGERPADGAKQDRQDDNQVRLIPAPAALCHNIFGQLTALPDDKGQGRQRQGHVALPD